jgi:hypothetical protein
LTGLSIFLAATQSGKEVQMFSEIHGMSFLRGLLNVKQVLVTVQQAFEKPG